MKKKEKIIIGIILVAIIVGGLVFSKTRISQNKEDVNKSEPEEKQSMINDSNEDYSLEKAVENGYFVIAHNKIYNKDKLDQFIENTNINSKNRVEDSIKIVQYTTEGDPIITELSYKIKDETYLIKEKPTNKSTYTLKIDNTKDKWSAEEDRKVTINEDIPGEIYGITEKKDGDIVNIDLELYAIIDYIDENAKKYETIHVCSYSSNAQQEQNVSFYGKVIEANQKYILVEPNEREEIRKSADKISIGLGEENDALYMVGTNVKITYNGIILESYPAQVKASKIEIKSAENFETLFYDKHPMESYKIYTILDKSESDKYDYTIYGYDGSVNIRIDGKDYSLKEALSENKITMEEVISKANQDEKNGKIKVDMYKDGGSMEYHYENYTIIKCHTLDGNRDVYIGTKDLKLTDVI